MEEGQEAEDAVEEQTVGPGLLEQEEGPREDEAEEEREEEEEEEGEEGVAAALPPSLVEQLRAQVQQLQYRVSAGCRRGGGGGGGGEKTV